MSKKQTLVEAVKQPTVLAQANTVYGGLSPVIQVHINTINDYVRAMKPGNMVNPQEGALWTQRLNNALIAILEADNVEDMVDGMDKVLVLFRDHAKGALYMTYTQRFIDVWMVDEKKRDVFTALCYVLSVFSDPVKRERSGKVLLDVSEGGYLSQFNQFTRERLANYLNRYLV